MKKLMEMIHAVRQRALAAGLLLCLMMLIMTLGGCGLAGRLKSTAETYISTLAAKTGIADTFTLSSAKPDMSSKTDLAGFTVHSKTFSRNFTVFVSRDGKSVTDTYYTLSMEQMAQTELNKIVREVLGQDAPAAAAAFVPVSSEALSGRSFSSLAEFCKASGGSVLDLRLGAAIKEQKDVDAVLLALQEKGIFCRFYPFASDAVMYEILPDEFWITKRSGADGGAYANREKYEPGR